MQQHGSKYFTRRPPAYQINGNHKYSNMVANVLPADPPDWGWGQNLTFSEFGHVAYQI